MNIVSNHKLFYSRFGCEPAFVARAPGRVNILGEHVDYNEGLVLPAAIDRAVYLSIAPADERVVSLIASDLKAQVSFSLDDLADKVDIDGRPLPDWALYPAGVAWSLRRAGLEVNGLNGVYSSDIPIGAGLSSSAAVEVAFGIAWRELGGWEIEPLELAKLCQIAENHFVGVFSGLMDQFASVCGVEDHALFFDTRSLDWVPVPLPEGIMLIIADSGVRRSLTHSDYNDRRAACEEALLILQKHLPDVHSLRDISSTEFAAYAPYLPEIPRKRAEHVIKEIQRVESAYNALNRNDKQALGALLYSGHRSLQTLYEVSTFELDTLIEITRGFPGCIGARLTGAGFGGCTINLVEEEHANAFIKRLKTKYFEATGLNAAVYNCFAARGASILRSFESN